jgi:hypothetical protein
MVTGVTVIGDEKADGSDPLGSSLSVLETVAPSETVLDPVPEDDDSDVRHWGWRDEIEAAWKKRKPVYALCGKLVYLPARRANKECRACLEAQARFGRGRTGRY